MLAIAAIVGVVATCLAGAAQLRPIPTADLNHLVGAVTDPASVRHCTTVGSARYCLYAGFPHGVTFAWYAITLAAFTLAAAAMRDRWLRYTRVLRWPDRGKLGRGGSVRRPAVRR